MEWNGENNRPKTKNPIPLHSSQLPFLGVSQPLGAGEMHESMMLLLSAQVTPDVLAARLSKWQLLTMPMSHHIDIEVQNSAVHPFKAVNFPRVPRFGSRTRTQRWWGKCYSTIRKKRKIQCRRPIKQNAVVSSLKEHFKLTDIKTPPAPDVHSPLQAHLDLFTVEH
jgi:hypothetical protein